MCMARTYKWLGGIGYILGLVPYVSFISSIIVAIAWILMGKDTREKIFTVLGVLMLVMFASAIALIAWLFFSLMMTAYTVVPGALEPWRMGAAISQVLSQLWVLITAALVIVGLAIAVFILDIIAHFRAGKIFDSRWFKAAGWMRIILIIALVVSIPLTIFMIISAGPGMFSTIPALPDYGAIVSLLLTILWPMIIVLIVSLLATIFSVIAFFTIPEEASPA
ncbi:MAG: hypothetical protein QXI18_00860 [Nitrososphaerota archaeon]